MSDTELKHVIETGVIESIGLPLGKTAKILAISEDIFLDMKSQISELKAKLTAKDDQIERMREREKALQGLVYVPGYLRCAKCNFQGVYSNLNMQSGTVSANNKSHSCPNGCGPLWKVSERDARIKAQKAYEELWQRVKELEAANSWIPVSERLPAENQQCHFYSEHTDIYWSGRFRFGNSFQEPQYSEKGYRADCCGRFTNPTHYKPITPPTDKG